MNFFVVKKKAKLNLCQLKLKKQIIEKQEIKEKETVLHNRCELKRHYPIIPLKLI